jgi:hypothetical protein
MLDGEREERIGSEFWLAFHISNNITWGTARRYKWRKILQDILNIIRQNMSKCPRDKKIR